MYLYFEDRFGNKRLVNNKILNKEDCFKIIEDYIYKLNPKFKIPYVRTWGNNPTTFDVGSHTEFFLLYPEEIEC